MMNHKVQINSKTDLMTVALKGVEFSGIMVEFGETPGFPARTLFKGDGVTPGWENVSMTGKVVGDRLTQVSLSSNGTKIDMPESFKSFEEVDDWWEGTKKTLGL